MPNPRATTANGLSAHGVRLELLLFLHTPRGTWYCCASTMQPRRLGSQVGRLDIHRLQVHIVPMEASPGSRPSAAVGRALASAKSDSPSVWQAKSHSGPLQPRPTHTPSRGCAPCSLACFHFFFREVPLLSRPRPAQPLLLTADSAGSSVFLSPIGVTIAAARPCMLIECVSAKNACPAVPGSMPAHADPCGDNVSFTG